MAGRRYFVDEAFLRRIDAIEQKLNGIRGRGVSANTPLGILINGGVPGFRPPAIPEDSFLKFVWLWPLDDEEKTYDIFPESDPDLEGDPIEEAVKPALRPLGSTAVDFAKRGETGLGYFNEDQEFILLVAWEEEYDLSDCGDEELVIDDGDEDDEEEEEEE